MTKKGLGQLLELLSFQVLPSSLTRQAGPDAGV